MGEYISQLRRVQHKGIGRDYWVVVPGTEVTRRNSLGTPLLVQLLLREVVKYTSTRGW